MEDILYSDALNWLRQGNEIETATVFEKCDLELEFVDMWFELEGERDYMMYDVILYAPRDIYLMIKEEPNTHIEQIEEAVRTAVSAGTLIRGIDWKGKALSRKTESPIQAITLDSLQRTGVERVKLDWQRTLNRLESDPEGAITAAKTLFESVCKLILDDNNVSYSNNDDLPQLYRKVTKTLEFSTDKQVNDIYRRVFGGAQTIVGGLAEMRNKLGDAHGKGQNVVVPERHQAALAVNLAGALTVFLIEAWQPQSK